MYTPSSRPLTYQPAAQAIIGTTGVSVTPTAPEPCPVCPSLPSSETAQGVVTGQPGSVWLLARDVLVRAGLISLGMAAVNGGYTEGTLKNALGGSLGIEGFVLAYTWWKNQQVTR